jgi:hypothetical protein
MTGIGFGKAPEKTDKWEKKLGGTTFEFTKTREQNVYLYNCKSSSEGKRFITASSRGFRTDRNLARTEIESCEQFREFIASHSI